MKSKNIVIACQGGGSHAAYAAGALQTLLPALQKEECRLVGISGTSGGAICALLAWYGLLQGGTGLAQTKLTQFWQTNCAQLPGEVLWNETTLRTLGTMRQEVLFSPYEWPLKASEIMLTQIWPSFAQILGTNNHWIRADYFRLGELVSSHVNFELIAALGEFLHLPSDIQKWLDNDIHAKLCHRSETLQKTVNSAKDPLEHKIRNALAMPEKLLQLMDTHTFGPAAPLRLALQKWEPDLPAPDLSAHPLQKFDAASLTRLSEQIKQLMLEIPQLLLGAADIGSGEFTAFSSEKPATEGGISLPAVLASAALPWLFEAVQIDKESADGNLAPHKYWDGLFSQNPPIRNFVSNLVCENKKPDEFWVLQINPGVYDINELASNIWDRRNELAGNLSLNQEISFIKAINKRCAQTATGEKQTRQENADKNAKTDKAGKADKADKHMQVHRIILDNRHVEQVLENAHVNLASGQQLGALSKFNRDIKLKDALFSHGHEQAEKFLQLHHSITDICDNLHSPAYDMPAKQHEVSDAALTALRSIASPDGKNPAHLSVNQICLPSISRLANQPNAADATVSWQTHGITEEGVPLWLEGESDFMVVKNGQTQIHLRDIKITELEIMAPATGIAITTTTATKTTPVQPIQSKLKPGGKAISAERRLHSVPVPAERRAA